MDPASLAATFSSGRDMSLSGGKADLGDQTVSQGFGGFGNSGGGVNIGDLSKFMPGQSSGVGSNVLYIGAGLAALFLVLKAVK